MTTSIIDLLTTLDNATQARRIDARDAASALRHASRVLSTVRADGLGRDYPPNCLSAIRRLDQACTEAATSFGPEAGRISDLTGVLADAVATLRYELTDADRWAVATHVAPITRRFVNAIRGAGPYQDVPELLSLLDRASELQKAAAIKPPDLDRIRGLDAPIPTTWRRSDLSADAAILDATAALAAEFRRRDRPPANIRELIAVCHVASRVAARLLPGSDVEAAQLADVWTCARTTLSQYSDGIALPAPCQPRSALLLKAMRVEAEVRRASAPGQELERGSRHRPSVDVEARSQLRRLANACHAELGRVASTLVVLPGRAPISNDRVGEWLRHEPFRVTVPDLQPALAALERAGPWNLMSTV